MASTHHRRHAAQPEQIVINGRFLDRPITGVERHGHEIIKALDALLAERAPQTAGLEFEILRPRSQAPDLELAQIRQRRVGNSGGYRWEQATLPRAAAGRLILNFCNLAPLAGRSITCVHDANVWLMPQSFSPRFRLAYRLLIPLLIRRSRHWVTGSAYSNRALLQCGAADRPAAALIGNSGAHISNVSEAGARLTNASLAGPFVFALGSRSANKNFQLLEEIAPALAKAGIRLLVAGALDNDRVFDRQPKAAGSLELLGRVSDADLVRLYRRALCFLAPAYYEGSTIPPLESMIMGCPVLSSNHSSQPETLGGGAIFLDPDDRESWINAVLELHHDRDRRAEQVARGHAHADGLRWRRSALDYVDLIRRPDGAPVAPLSRTGMRDSA